MSWPIGVLSDGAEHCIVLVNHFVEPSEFDRSIDSATTVLTEFAGSRSHSKSFIHFAK